jgi:tetratricopeptide (TPR) repeat protein
MLDHYLYTAQTADSLLSRKLSPITLAPIQPGAVAETLAGPEEALAWFLAESPALLAAIAPAPAGFDTHTWQLASALTTFLDRQGRWPALVRAQLTALDAAHRHDDRTGQATAHRCLGVGYAMLKSPGEAHRNFRIALDLFGELGNHLGLARTHQALSQLTGNQGRHQDSLDHASHALEHCQAAGDRGGQSSALNNLGWLHSQLGDHHQALADCRRALALAVETGDLSSQAHICDSLGYVHHHLGRYDDAVTSYRRALELFQRTGDQHNKATCLGQLGDTHHDAGAPAAAREAWAQALTIADQLALPDTDPLRTKLLDCLARFGSRRADRDR